MKSAVSIIFFLVVGLLTAILFGFRSELWTTEKPYDELQEGMKERIVIKFSHVVAENTPKGLAAEKFVQTVKEKTNDRVEVQVFPNGILYSDNNEFEALQRGDVQMIAPAFSKLSNISSQYLIFDLPYAFPDQVSIHEAFDGPIGEILFHSIEKQNVKQLAFWSNGFKQMSSDKQPLLTPKDFKGHTFRIMSSKAIESQMNLLGAKSVVMPFTEVYGNIKSGIVNAQENTFSNIYTKQLYQVQSHVTISNHAYLGYAVLVNEDFWNSLEPELRDQIEEAMLETSYWNRVKAIAMNDQQQKLLEEKTNISIYELTPEQKEEWVRTLQPVYDQFHSIIGDELMGMIKKNHNE
ncbi:DctP family TRAP transporter solute-binding subunit [Brevibacillus daliensis]|uniref:DctP family TRAP transporter solute-binding subunit n=1 Tax=Brevibacillus daliensis TaxID=2892995 RepID=UPI001E51C97F|nr:DctP family TRAP transporter solute-binding subunit [Brevibacillus daliensis]